MADPGVAAEVSVSDLVLVPMKLEAFVLNEAVSDGGEFEAKIAPITQPNYTFLRPEEFYIQNDILNQIDIHAASPASKNSRVTDLRTGLPRANRLGVYLHWTLPRLYRTAAVSKDAPGPGQDTQTPQLAPARWLVVRHIVPGSFAPADAEINELDAWVIETEPGSGNANISIREQAEVFIGKKTALADWDKDATGPRVQVSLFNSSNQLFPDYQPHNSNVFSMVDPLDYGDGKKLTSAKMSYYVAGWHASSDDDPFSRGMATAGTDKLGVLKALSLILKDETTKGIAEWSSASASPTQAVCHGAMYDVEWDASRKPTGVLADIFAKKLNDQLPVAIGETPINALLAFVDAHKAMDTDKGEIDRLNSSIDALKKQLPDAKPAAKPPFSRALDPTLLVGGVPSGWPHDFLQNTPVRLRGQIVQPSSQAATTVDTVSLRQIISQLFADTPEAVLDDYLSKAQQDEMKQELEAGFNSPMSNRRRHSPTGRQTMDDAFQASKAGGLTLNSLDFIGDETALTPYGTLVTALTGSSMFKPATHGQFRMIKLNIVDKFGQVVHAINPSVPPNEAKPLYPCISERLRHQSKAANPLAANTVQEDKPGNCESVQLPPRINQPARINAHFVDIMDGVGPLREDENPVWGWLVVNFPDSGLQLFQADGTFCREIRFGGPKGTLASDDWLPFGPPRDAADRAKSTKVAQLNGFIERLKDASYLQGIVSMIEESSKNSPAAPNAYAETLASVIGKPLALVNVGWSLELAGDAYSNQSDFHTALPSDLSLLGGPQSSVSGHYTFPIKIGDKNRLFDGTIGYFSPRSKGTATASDFYNLDTLHTYYVSNPAGTGDPRSELTTASYPKLSPMWIPPFSNQPDLSAVDPSSYAATYARSLTVVGALIDPFCPINVYSGILPPKPLRLLPWVWQEAFSKMTAFFHLGPLVMTHEVPPYSTESTLTDRWDQVALVAVECATMTPVAATAFIPLAVDQVAPGVAFDKAPYTAIEGYLQMRRAIEKTS
ncbi:hypothetical protein B0T22DRAFT_487822 [Podospora appendiculata]|uniref:Uncharacterized protein n=1 Tax=Podospora appendiculata TaxID=314037 RepID=A0AAE0XJ94_9PEZI|nr:hypothetical protein B0T22DRAFT_487822 [Podospora appendiculata]